MPEGKISRDIDAKDVRATAVKYEQPRVERGRRLADVTGQRAVAPSGAPVPPPPPG